MVPDEHASQRVAQVAVDIPLPHLDRVFDYAVPARLAAAAVTGCRVRVRFAGRLVTGYLLDLVEQTSHRGHLTEIASVISPEPVLTPELRRLIREVADHWGGTFADVARLAIPRRHAATEKAEPPPYPDPHHATITPQVLQAYPDGPGFLTALRNGNRPRATWNPVPVHDRFGDWIAGVGEAAAATLASGRDVVVVVPDQRDVDRVLARFGQMFGIGSVLTLTADLGPAARYRNFLACTRGQAHLVVGTRAAVFAPVRRPGLIVVVDDGNDVLQELRMPYPHARDVAAIRASISETALLYVSYHRTAEVQLWVERGWLHPITLDSLQVRRHGPMVRVASDRDTALDRDPAAFSARIPHDVFTLVRKALTSGPVLVQVPRAGYVVAAFCRRCGTPVTCRQCRQSLVGSPGADQVLAFTCSSCGPPATPWSCPECGHGEVRTPGIGALRTAEELGKAFPGVPLKHSTAGHILTDVDDKPAIVVATPGAEPIPTAGYAAAILLDTDILTTRPELRADEEALRRWLSVAALVRPAGEGGTLMAVGNPQSRTMQALIRLDPAGFATRELQERHESGFPPAATLFLLDGDPEALLDCREAVPGTLLLDAVGPVPHGQHHRLTLRCATAQRAAALQVLVARLARRSARKQPGMVHLHVDPLVID